MGVYFKDMKIPKSCLYCPMRKWHIIHGEKITYCMAAVKPIDDENEKPNWCSAQEIQTPHGRLIEEPELLSYGGLAKISPFNFNSIAKYFADQVKAMPTIVEAEE